LKHFLRRLLDPDPKYTQWIEEWERVHPPPAPGREDWPTFEVVVRGEPSEATLASVRKQTWDLVGAGGLYLAELGADDLLHPHALRAVALEIQRTGAVALYTDEDFVDALGRRMRPLFKPDWSPSLQSPDYPGNLRVVRRDVTAPNSWHHVRRVLYHRRGV
jgi:hypothetical protein